MLFPKHTFIPEPSPLTASEKSAVAHYRNMRSRLRDSPLYAILDKSVMLDPDTGRPSMRRGWDAFEGMESEGWSARYRKRTRGLPDLDAFREKNLGEEGFGESRTACQRLSPVI